MNGITLLKYDIKNISRDFILFILLPAPVFLAILFRIALPYISLLTSQWINVYSYTPLILMFLIVMGPLLIGMASGLMLVDKGDEKIISAISVTPLGKNGYIFYKLTAPFIWTFFILLPVPFLSGLAEIPYLFYIPIILTASFGAPLEALLIAALASNKVEAMAIGKVTGVLFLPPFISWFVPAPWRFLSGLLPGFWVSESYFNGVNGEYRYFIYITAGLLIHILSIMLLLKKYNSRIDQV